MHHLNCFPGHIFQRKLMTHCLVVEWMLRMLEIFLFVSRNSRKTIKRQETGTNWFCWHFQGQPCINEKNFRLPFESYITQKMWDMHVHAHASNKFLYRVPQLAKISRGKYCCHWWEINWHCFNKSLTKSCCGNKFRKSVIFLHWLLCCFLNLLFSCPKMLVPDNLSCFLWIH